MKKCYPTPFNFWLRRLVITFGTPFSSYGGSGAAECSAIDDTSMTLLFFPRPRVLGNFRQQAGSFSIAVEIRIASGMNSSPACSRVVHDEEMKGRAEVLLREPILPLLLQKPFIGFATAATTNLLVSSTKTPQTVTLFVLSPLNGVW